MLAPRWRRPRLVGTQFMRGLQHQADDKGSSSEAPRVFHFKCTQCGKCCTGKGGRVRVNDREMAALQRELRVSSDELQATYLTQATSQHSGDAPGDAPTWRIKQTDDDAQCIFLKGTKCAVYQARPTQCRTFPWWPQHLISDYDWRLVARDCDGVTSSATGSDGDGGSYQLQDVLPDTIVYDIHRSGENYTYDELHEMLRDLEAVDPSFVDEYAQELHTKFRRRVVYTDDHVTVLDTFLEGAPPSRYFVFNDRLHLVQSEIHLTSDGETLDPSVLVLDVHQAMSKAIAWLVSRKATPWKIGVLGSGGGSLVRYIFHMHGDSVETMDAVEPNAHVNHIARRFFGLDDLPKMTLHEEYGENFVNRQLVDLTTHGKYDVLFIDVEAGSAGDSILAPPLSMLTKKFLNDIQELIRSGGVIAINVITDDYEALRQVATRIVDAMASDTTAVYMTLPKNTVIFLVKDAPIIKALQATLARDGDPQSLHSLNELLQ